MTRTKRILCAALCLGLAATMFAPALADDWYGNSGEYYSVYNEDGQVLFSRAGAVYVDDEYISGDNKLYRITAVDDSARRGQVCAGRCPAR